MALSFYLSEPRLWTFTLIIVAIFMATTFFLTISIRFFRRDPLVQEIQGPVDSASWLYGNLPELMLSQPHGKFEFKWQKRYGSTYRIKGCFSEDLLFTSDPATVRQLLNGDNWDFPPSRRFIALTLFGEESILSKGTGGDAHRRIKNAFSPAFAPSRLQSYVPIMRDIAKKAADKLMEENSMGGNNSETAVDVDIFHLLQYVTSDVIGEVGFGHNFDAVETGGGDEIAQSHQSVVILGSIRSKGAILGNSVVSRLPRTVLKQILSLPMQPFATLSSFRKTSGTWATKLLTESLEDNDKDSGLVGFVASANKNVKRDRLTFTEISQQSPTFLVAGQETTANSVLWMLYELAKRPTWQDQIRKQINEAKDMDSNLDKLEYLNAHIKETLRTHATVPHTERIALEDTVLPLSQPLTTTSGRVVTQLPVRKGQTIYFGMASYNRNPYVWGPDADMFDPLRWIDGRCDSRTIQSSIGPYSNLATFGGGLRSCLGWRLAILEMQIILSELIPRFRFSFNPGQEEDVTSIFAITLLPVNMKGGKPGLPLVIQPI